MKTRFDDLPVYRCTQACWYAEADFEEGNLVLGSHPVIRHLSDCFERLPDDHERAIYLREELEFRKARLEELDREEARDRVRKQRERIGRQSEASFWRDTAALLSEAESRELDELPDPALEAEEAKIAEERSRARYDPDSEAFWDESAALVERYEAERIFPLEERKATQYLDDEAVMSQVRKLLGDG